VQCGGDQTGMPLTRCPNKVVTARELDAVRAVALAETGVLPEAGGWQDQPGTWTQVYFLIAAEISRQREAQRQAAARAAKAG